MLRFNALCRLAPEPLSMRLDHLPPLPGCVVDGETDSLDLNRL
jgi:hypothetical protein